MTFAAAVAAWLGAAAIVLADGRRGLALGLALVAAAFTTLAWTEGEWLGGVFLLIGGAVFAVQQLRTAPHDWGLMPTGSTPRTILAAVAAILSLWVAVSVSTGSGGPLRFASLAVLGLMAARLLQGRSAITVLTAAAGLALALAGSSALAPSGAGFAPYLLGAVIAAGVSFLPVAESRRA